MTEFRAVPRSGSARIETRLAGARTGRISRRAVSLGVPKEEEEQVTFVNWCRLNHILVHHSGNEIGGSSAAVKVRAIKMKKMGTSKGFPDLLVFIPVNDVDGNVGSYQMAAIEMKRTKGSTTSAEQKEWLKVLELAGIPCAVCKGCEAAIEFVNGLIEDMR